MRAGGASLRQYPVVRRVFAAATVAACLLVPTAYADAAPEPRAFVPPSLSAAAEAQPDAVFAVVVQGREGKSSRGVAAEVTAERARTPGKGKGLRRQFRAISGVSAELTGKQIAKLANKRWVLAITPDAPMVATEELPEPPPPFAPVSIVAPTLSGVPEAGETLAAGEGLWSGGFPLAYAFQWQRCSAAGDECADIDGATAAGYTLGEADTGATVRVVVTVTDAGGAASASSDPSAVIAAPPVVVQPVVDEPVVDEPVVVEPVPVVAPPPGAPTNTEPPTVFGTAQDGETLFAGGSSWSSAEPLDYAYQWQRCDSLGDGCADIADATTPSYTLTPEDVGATVRLAVTAANFGGSATAASAPTAQVAAILPANVLRPAVIGGAEEGLMLTAAMGGWTGTPPLRYAYQWQRCDSDTCSDIPGATYATYLIGAADIGGTVQLVVTATNAAGITTASSPPTSVVVPAPLLAGESSRQLWPYAAGVTGFWDPEAAGGPAIAIVDSGIDAARPDFGGRVVQEVTLTTLTPNGPGDGRGHGTFVASIAAGEAAGFTGAYPQANLVSIDVMDDDGEAMTSDVIAAADWILEHKDEYDIRVANFSLTGSVDSTFRFDPVNKAVERLWLSGVVVVVAAGNYALDGQESGVRFSPGVDPFVITVGATDVNATVSTSDDVAAPWSAFGHTHDGFAKPELSAPGRYMVGAVPPDSRLATERPERLVEPGYMQLSGTSFSAPIVSGAAAALLAAHPDWTPDQVKGALMLSADATAALPAFATGVGALDAEGATAVADPPNPNAPLNEFLVADPAGGPGLVFDEPGWSAAVEADPTWGSSHWGSSHWGSAAWSVSHWGSASWSASHWGSSQWGSSHWGSDTTWTGDSHWGSATNNAAEDALPGGGYWVTRASG